MMNRYTKGGMLLVMMGLALLGLSDPAFAQENGSGSGTGGVQPSECDSYVGLTNRIAGCIRATIDSGAAKFFTDFYPLVQTSITAVMTLAVIVYGVFMAYGMVEKIGRDTMVILLKVSAVAMFTTSSPLIYSWVTQAMDGAAVAAVSYVPASGAAYSASSSGGSDGDFSQNKCLQTMVEQQQNADASKPPVGPWLGIDCLVDTVIGIKGASELASSGARQSGAGINKALDPEAKGMSRGLIFFFFSGMQSSVIGLVMAIIGFVFVFGFLMLIVQAFFTYIAAYMGIALLVIVSPLFIPMILFTSTKQYFDKWVKLLISFALQPVLILVFISFSIAAMDFAVFSGNYSIMYRIAGEASRQEGFSFNKYLDGSEGKDRGTDRGTGNSNDTASSSSGSGGASSSGSSGGTAAKEIITRTPRQVLETKGANAENNVPLDSDLFGGTLAGARQSRCSKEAIAKDTTGNLKKECGFTYGLKLWMGSIDWDVMATKREVQGPAVELSDGAQTKGQQIAREVVAAVLFCAVVMFILNGLLAIVPMVANDILGDAHQTPSLMGMFTGKAGASSGAMGGIISKFKSSVNGAVGRR